MLSDASSIQSIAAANSSGAPKAGLNGIRKSAMADRMAPVRKYGRRRPRRFQVRSERWPMIGCTSRPVSGAATHSAGRSSMLDPSVWKTRLMFEFCSAKPIWMPKNPKLIFHSPAKFWRGFSRNACVMRSPSSLATPVFVPAAALLVTNAGTARCPRQVRIRIRWPAKFYRCCRAQPAFQGVCAGGGRVPRSAPEASRQAPAPRRECPASPWSTAGS